METILCGDALEQLRTLEPESVHTCVTSPPYYNLRDYGAAGQIGMEETPEEYIAKLVDVFREVRRVLRPDGTLWVNIGDSYATRSGPQPPANTRNAHGHTRKEPPDGYKCKDLMGIPWLLAFALRADGWYLRQDIIWHKTNAMPESVQDRCTKAHEYIFLLSKSAHYYFDAAAIREPCGKKGNARTFRGGGAYTGGRSFQNSARVERESHGNTVNSTGGRNKRSVWSIATGQFKAAHYAERVQLYQQRHKTQRPVCNLHPPGPFDTGPGNAGMVSRTLGGVPAHCGRGERGGDPRHPRTPGNHRPGYCRTGTPYRGHGATA